MRIFLLICHLIVTLTMIAVILFQRSEGGLGSMGGGGLVSARGATNFLTRTTGILATLFIIINIALAYLAGQDSKRKLLSTIETPVTAPLETKEATDKGAVAKGEVPQEKTTVKKTAPSKEGSQKKTGPVKESEKTKPQKKTAPSQSAPSQPQK